MLVYPVMLIEASEQAALRVSATALDGRERVVALLIADKIKALQPDRSSDLGRNLGYVRFNETGVELDAPKPPRRR